MCKIKFLIETTVGEEDQEFVPDLVFVDEEDNPHYVSCETAAVSLVDEGIYKVEAFRFLELIEEDFVPLKEIPENWKLDNLSLNMDCRDYKILKQSVIRD